MDAVGPVPGGPGRGHPMKNQGYVLTQPKLSCQGREARGGNRRSGSELWTSTGAAPNFTISQRVRGGRGKSFRPKGHDAGSELREGEGMSRGWIRRGLVASILLTTAPFSGRAQEPSP